MVEPKEIILGLYNYESKKFTESKLEPKDDNFIALNSGNQFVQLENQSNIQDDCFLFHINFKNDDDNDDNIYIDNLILENNIYQNKEIIDDLENNLWYVIHSDEKENIDNKYNLIEGDIIKLGNAKFLINRINIISINNKEKNRTPNFQNFNIDANPVISTTLKNYKKCKLCESYYIPICECEKRFHFSCFQELYNEKQDNNRIQIENSKKNNVKKYCLKNFFCSNCNCQFSYEYILPKPEDKRLNSINYTPNEDKDFIILESLGTEDKTVFFVFLTDDDIIIGNNNENSDIVINDESIKEKHAKIYLDNEKIWIENLNNDFDVNVLVRNEILLNENKILLKVKNNVFYLELND